MLSCLACVSFNEWSLSGTKSQTFEDSVQRQEVGSNRTNHHSQCESQELKDHMSKSWLKDGSCDHYMRMKLTQGLQA